MKPLRHCSAAVFEGAEVPFPVCDTAQVYKGRLAATGQQVAVKVQRPRIGESIAMDMLLLRRLMAAVDRYLPQVCSALRPSGIPHHMRYESPSSAPTRAVLAQLQRGCNMERRAAVPAIFGVAVVQVTSLPIQPLVPLVDEFAGRLFGELDYIQVVLPASIAILLHSVLLCIHCKLRMPTLASCPADSCLSSDMCALHILGHRRGTAASGLRTCTHTSPECGRQPYCGRPPHVGC